MFHPKRCKYFSVTYWAFSPSNRIKILTSKLQRNEDSEDGQEDEPAKNS